MLTFGNLPTPRLVEVNDDEGFAAEFTFSECVDFLMSEYGWTFDDSLQYAITFSCCELELWISNSLHNRECVEAFYG